MDMKSILYKNIFSKYCVLKIPQPSQGTNLTHSLPKILRNLGHFLLIRIFTGDGGPPFLKILMKQSNSGRAILL